MHHSGSFNEADEDREEAATANEVADEITAIDLELQKLQIELAAEKVQINIDSAEIKKIAEDTQRKQR